MLSFQSHRRHSNGVCAANCGLDGRVVIDPAASFFAWFAIEPFKKVAPAVVR